MLSPDIIMLQQVRNAETGVWGRQQSVVVAQK